jgi:pyruvate formate lyase activating enzyme
MSSSSQPGQGAPSEAPSSEVPLVASPYDLRVSLGEKVSESGVREALESGETGFVHSFTTGSAVDGPGVRVVAWLTACQFRCVYCHNPDTWKLTNGIPVKLSRAIEVLRQYRTGLGVMKGGLTISGGEPLLQHRFVLNVFAAAKSMSVHTALDTNGYLGDRLSDEDLKSVDLVLLDLKAYSGDLHRRLTSLENEPVLNFARRLGKLNKPAWVRFVLVPGWTDDLAEVERIAAFASELGNVERVDVLPFHQLGKFKWDKLGMQYALRDTQPPSPQKTQEVVACFQAKGLKAY